MRALEAQRGNLKIAKEYLTKVLKLNSMALDAKRMLEKIQKDLKSKIR